MKRAIALVLLLALPALAHEDADVTTRGQFLESQLPAATTNSVSDHEERLTTLEGEVSGTLFTSSSAPVDGTDACDIGDIWLDSGTPSICHCTNAGTDQWACAATTN